MITLRANEAYNSRFAPPGAKKAYIARITGRDAKMTFAREFIGKTSADVDTPGLYETRSVDKKGIAESPDFYVVMEREDEVILSTILPKEDAMEIAKRLDAGERIDQIVETHPRPSRRDPTKTVYDVDIVTAKQAAATAAAKTVETATDACWEILKTLPEKDVKKVLAALKVLNTPPKPLPVPTPPPGAGTTETPTETVVVTPTETPVA